MRRAAVPLFLSLLLFVFQSRNGTTAANHQDPGPAAAESTIACLTGDSLLDLPVVRELLRVLWQHSRADARPAQRRERGAILFDTAGVLFYRADLDNLRDTPCRSAVQVPLDGTPVAAFFTHPFRPGDTLPPGCGLGDDNLHRYTVDQFGGPSEEDIAALLDWEVPGYIMDKQNIYAVPLGTTKETALLVVKRYPRLDRILGCMLI